MNFYAIFFGVGLILIGFFSSRWGIGLGWEVGFIAVGVVFLMIGFGGFKRRNLPPPVR